MSARPMLWPSGHELIEEQHNGEYASPPVASYFLRNASIGGRGAQPRRDDYVWGVSAFPGYVRAFIEADERAASWRFDAALPSRHYKTLISILHPNLIYGHFLLEMFPKAFTIWRQRNAGISAPIAWPATAPDYMLQIMRSALPEAEFAVYHPEREQLTADMLILPGSMETNHQFNTQVEYDLRDYRNFTRPVIQAPRIYISRRGLQGASTFRSLRNEAAIEGFMRDRGFTVVQPEGLPHRVQVAAFSNAGIIVGEYGSGLHTAMFSPAGTKVVAFNYINGVQSKLGNLLGHDVGYILPKDGILRRFGENAPPDFEIDLDELAERIDSLLAQDG